MKNLSNILTEDRGEEFLQKEITRYITAMSGKLPRKVQAALYIINKYPSIQTKEDVLAIRDGHMKVYAKLGILPDDLKDLQKMLKSIGNDIKLLPHFLNDYQRQALEQNKLGVQDVTLDLETKQGREHVAKTYAPLVIKIAGQLANKSNLDKSELISAGLEGLTLAMDDYKSNEDMEAEGKTGTQTFGQYAAYRIRFAMLDEINNNSRTVAQSDYMRNKDGELGISSIDGKYGKDEDGDDIKIDRIMQLSEEPDWNLTRKEEQQWQDVFKNLEKKFSARDCNIFYRSFGINGFDKEEGKAIAKSCNVSAPFISQTIKKIVNFLRQDEESLEVLREILHVYESNLIATLIGKDKVAVFESLISDDLYIMAESIEKWANPKTFQQAISKATDLFSVEEALFIYDCIRRGLPYLEPNFKRNKRLIIAFLDTLYPAESFKRKTDNELMEYMSDLILYNEKHKLTW